MLINLHTIQNLCNHYFRLVGYLYSTAAHKGVFRNPPMDTLPAFSKHAFVQIVIWMLQ